MKWRSRRGETAYEHFQHRREHDSWRSVALIMAFILAMFAVAALLYVAG